MRVHLVFLLLVNFHFCDANEARSALDKSQYWNPQVWNSNGFAQTQISSLSLEPVSSKHQLTHEVSVSVIMFRQGGWNLDKIRTAFQRAAEIYAQCGIRLLAPKVVEVTSSEGVELDQSQVKKTARITPQTLPKPWVYFLSEPLGVGGKIENAYAFGRTDGKVPHYDTVWMGSRVQTTHYKMDRDSSYSPLAHELAHVLGDYDHFTGPQKNILSNHPLGKANDQITEDQCRKFKSYEFMRPIH